MPSANLFFRSRCGENGVRDGRCGCHTIVLLNHCFYAVGSQNLQRGVLGRRGERVRVLAHIQWAIRALDAAPEVANRLRDRQNVSFGKAARSGDPPCPLVRT
jgi:hypothetical protein